MEDMDKNILTKEICELVSDIIQKEIQPETRLLDNGGYVDSMNIMEMVTEIEEKYGINFDDELTLDYLDDVKSLVDCVWKLARGKGDIV